MLSHIVAAAVIAATPKTAPHKQITTGIPVLCYHDLQRVPQNDMTNTPENFEAHLKWLKEHGYQTLSVDQLVGILKRREPAPPKAVLITFDDGYEGVYKYAYPALKRYGFQATLFIVTSVMGKEQPPMPHLTWPEIEEMDKEGVVHAEVHADQLHVKLGLRLASEIKKHQEPVDIERDLKGAREEIERHIHHRVSYIAWPFGNYNVGLIRLAAKEGYYAMLNTEYGVNRPGDNANKIKRLRMSSKFDTLQRFEQKLAQYGLR